MASSGLPADIERFIVQHIDSVEQLEVLLMLADHPGRTWSAAQIAEEMRGNASSVAMRLEVLHALGLVERAGDPHEARYRYAPRTEEQRRAVRGLASAYQERRVSVINVIFSTPSDSVRAFADAFRLTRPKEDDRG